MAHAPIQVLTPPTAEPVTRPELIAQLRLNDSAGLEGELDRAITAARDLFEKQTARAVLPTTFRQFCNGFGDGIELQAGPVSSIVQVQYLDPIGSLQTLGGLELDNASIPAVAYLPGGNYPGLSERIRRPVRVDFIAGWPNADAVPKLVKLAILLLAAHYYENREAYRDSAFEMRLLPSGWARVVELHKTGLEWAV
jgi:uncharacterized phiE125 gp8 family phage protein